MTISFGGIASFEDFAKKHIQMTEEIKALKRSNAHLLDTNSKLTEMVAELRSDLEAKEFASDVAPIPYKLTRSERKNS